jgi:hypothetical protein
MISDNALVGWLCFFRLQNGKEVARTYLPIEVQEALCAKGWLSVDPETDWQGDHGGTITDEGFTMTDLYGPEWGIEVLPETSDQQ